MTSEQLHNLRTIASAAVATERATNVPAALITAQCVLESAWLMKCSGTNNPFGIKRSRRHSAGTVCETVEYVNGQPVRCQAEFAAYPTLEAAFADHALLIATGRPYARAWQAFRSSGDVDALIQGVASAYATDPAYAAKVKRLANDPTISAAIEEARGVAPLPPAA